MRISNIFKLEGKFNKLFILFVAITIIAGLLEYFKITKEYTGYNNFIIFRNSFYHLYQNLDLYSLYPNEHFDYYKYSPTFAILISPFTLLNNPVGLICWDLLNSVILFYAIKNIPTIDYRSKIYILLFILLELLTSVQNSQSNGLIAGLAVLSFNSLERNKIILAAFLICLGAYVKIFSIFLVFLAFLYKEKIKFFMWFTFFLAILFALPLVVTDINQLISQYKNWGALLKTDNNLSLGLSIAGWLYSWFNLTINKNILVITGIVLLSLPFLRFKMFENFSFRILCFASILIWVVIFNHKAESPTFIIAITGIALWYFTGSKSKFDTILILACFLFTCLSPTDLFPRTIRTNFVIPYVLKAIPCIIIWIKIMIDLLFKRNEQFIKPVKNAI